MRRASPTGIPIAPERLRRISGAEHILRDLGFAGTRVRDYGDLARIELQPADLERAAAWPLRRGMVEPLGDLGYRYVTLDLAGYRLGASTRCSRRRNAQPQDTRDFAGSQATVIELPAVGFKLGGGVARRGGLHRRNELSTMEVRSVRTPQPGRERLVNREDS